MNNPAQILYLAYDANENDHLLTQLRLRLACKGYHLKITLNEQEFWYELFQHHYHFLILDIEHQTNTVALLKKLKSLQQALPTFVVSKQQDPILAMKTIQNGCVDFLVKDQIPQRFFYDLLLKLFLFQESQKNNRMNFPQKATLPIPLTASWEWSPHKDQVTWKHPESTRFESLNYLNFIQRIHPEDQDLVKNQNNLCLFAHQPVSYTFRYLEPDHSITYFHLRLTPLLDLQGRIDKIIGSLNFSTQEDFKPIKIAYFDLTTDAVILSDHNHRIVAVNRGFSQLTNYPEATVLFQSSQCLVAEGATFDWLSPENTLKRHSFWQGESKLQTQSGSIPVWQSTAVLRDDSGKIQQMISVIRNISAQKARLAAIKLQANYDPLTRIPNRILLLDRLKNALKHARRNQTFLAVMLLDLNNFKWINDHFGHAAGDLVLKETTRKLQLATRESDTIGRLGGDEFVIILPNLEKAHDAEWIVRKVFAEFAKPVLFENQEITIAGSMGIAIYPDDGKNTDELLQNADRAMYMAKSQTHQNNRFYFFTASLQQETIHRQKIIRNIEKALRNQEFKLEYQPVIDINNRRVIFAEALLRWHHPEQGNIPLEKFLPIAEESGIIKEIGLWVISQIAEHFQRWAQIDLPLLSVSLNQSINQYNAAECHQQWLAILRKKQIPAHKLIFEVSESLFLDNNQNYHHKIKILQKAGIKIALDKFGTGYSSLTCLQKKPADYLKIDRSFIQKMTKNNTDAAIVNSILAVANSLKISVIATGVEKQQQLTLLGNECHYAQGYLFSKPLPLNQFEDFVFKYNTAA
jgi:diguanylate cyclase (GGDEF)-like protein